MVQCLVGGIDCWNLHAELRILMLRQYATTSQVFICCITTEYVSGNRCGSIQSWTMASATSQDQLQRYIPELSERSIVVYRRHHEAVESCGQSPHLSRQRRATHHQAWPASCSENFGNDSDIFRELLRYFSSQSNPTGG